MRGVLNEKTHVVHRYEPGQSDFQTPCGATSHVAHDRLRIATVEEAMTDSSIRKCGGCFSDAGGY